MAFSWATAFPPPVKQTPEPELFSAFMPASHLPIADPYDLGRLPPRDLPSPWPVISLPVPSLLRSTAACV
jgi:hypothetical protein